MEEVEQPPALELPQSEEVSGSDSDDDDDAVPTSVAVFARVRPSAAGEAATVPSEVVSVKRLSLIHI